MCNPFVIVRTCIADASLSLPLSRAQTAMSDAASKKKSKKAASSEEKIEGDSFTIKPEAVTAPVDTSKWPLLLKVDQACADTVPSWRPLTLRPLSCPQNYNSLLVRTGHYTPIPQGCSPLKREIKEYIRYAPPSAHECVALWEQLRDEVQW